MTSEKYNSKPCPAANPHTYIAQTTRQLQCVCCVSETAAKLHRVGRPIAKMRARMKHMTKEKVGTRSTIPLDYVKK